MPETTVLIADDHPLFRKGLRQVIEEEAHVRVVAEASNGREALELIRRHLPDVVVVDIEMPHVDGFAVARAVRDEGLMTRVIMLTMHKDETMLREAFALGASGYVLKHSAAAEVLDSIRAVTAGESYVSPAMASMLIRTVARGDELSLLTPTEKRILRMLADFRTSKEIAGELSISFRTVETHRNNICTKLGLEGKHSLLKFAAEHKGRLSS
jgi:DNA-binding NarL/FixJ family response regulator